MLGDAGHDVVFATERGGTAPAADPLLLSGVLFGKLGAEQIGTGVRRSVPLSDQPNPGHLLTRDSRTP